jgi:23S rRNA pseudouridine1911/1915/1917 synthase
MEFIVAGEQAGRRLDHFLVCQSLGFSRAYLQKLIVSGAVKVNSSSVKTGYKLRSSDVVTLEFPEKQVVGLIAEPVEFSVLYEDDDLLVINKPAGLVVHPGDGNRQGTLVNGLLYRYGLLSGYEPDRPGIVHRLDKDTTGIIVVARTDFALSELGKIFRNRQVVKKYHALLLRHPGKDTGRLVAPIGRHPVNRKKMAVRSQGRYAATRWSVKKRWLGFSLAEIIIETGRTHQIRVHMASLGSPIAGDKLYGGAVIRTQSKEQLMIERQLLHASTISFKHPVSGEDVSFTAPLPDDMLQVIEKLG